MHSRGMPACSLRLGEFDPADIQPYKSLTAADVCTNASQALALDAANQVRKRCCQYHYLAGCNNQVVCSL